MIESFMFMVCIFVALVVIPVEWLLIMLVACVGYAVL